MTKKNEPKWAEISEEEIDAELHVICEALKGNTVTENGDPPMLSEILMNVFDIYQKTHGVPFAETYFKYEASQKEKAIPGDTFSAALIAVELADTLDHLVESAAHDDAKLTGIIIEACMSRIKKHVVRRIKNAEKARVAADEAMAKVMGK